MLNSERRSLARFLSIYLLSTFLLFSIASWIFYDSAKYHMLSQQKELLEYESDRTIAKLRELHMSDSQRLKYPIPTNKINSVIYDTDKSYIFGTIKQKYPTNISDTVDTLQMVSTIFPHYLGAGYLLLTKAVDHTPMTELRHKILLFMLIGGLLFMVLGYYLGRLFVSPMRDAMTQMNRFIQDTTHEMNTPISTILTNIEMIETFGKYDGNADELNRIAIASKTLSHIYDDLAYLNLNHDYHRDIKHLNISTLLQERVAYFSSMSSAKMLEVTTDISDDIYLDIDQNDAIRLIDNIISNSIKYNRAKGTLSIILTEKILSISDSGVGIKSESMSIIMERFRRVDSSEGGFGIGLSIIQQIVDYYGYTISIESEFDKGTEVMIRW